MNEIKLTMRIAPAIQGEAPSSSKLSLNDKFSDAFKAAQNRLATGIRPATPMQALFEPRLSTAKTSSGHAKDDMALHERALALRGHRQVLLASNIANADTPGYKSVDFDIFDALKKGVAPKDVVLLYDIPRQGSLDGNTVDLDVQRAKFAENAIMYEFSLEKASNKQMLDLLKNLP